MIDLRKPLEGVPGLLLMGALIFFGATLGIAFALAASWIEMKDSIANFLGGVVGAGLGSLGGVLGAIYVFWLGRRAQLAKPFNALFMKLQEIQLEIGALRFAVQSDAPEVRQSGQRGIPLLVGPFASARQVIKSLILDPELPQKTNGEIIGLKVAADISLGVAEAYARGGPQLGAGLAHDEARREQALQSIDELRAELQEFIQRIVKELPH